MGRTRLLGRAVLRSVALAIIALIAAPAAGANQVDDDKAKKVKIAYLYNFSRYIDWPTVAFSQSDAPFVVGVLGDDPFGSKLDKLAKKKFGGERPIVIRRFASWEEYEACHVLFIPSGAGADLGSRAIEGTRDLPLLLVSDVGSTTELSPPIRLYLDADVTIGFEVNLTETRQRKLKIDAKLLKLARVVDPGSTRPSQDF